MAVETPDVQPETGVSGGRRFMVGTNVVVATLLVAAIVVVVQAIAFSVPNGRWDVTSSGVNSLSQATENLLRGLDQEIRLT